jgi:SAM-dependent methyltransferase
VTGVDVSADLQERARREPADGAPIEWVLGDAQQFDLGADRFDVVISRFGVMFFADPIAAFANLARSTRPEGRLVVAVWQRREHSPVMQHNIGVAAAAAARLGVELAFPPPDVGPCSLGTPDVVQHVLGGAGWRDITIRDHTLAMYAAGPGTVADIVDTSMTIGGLGAALAGQPDDLVAAVREALIDDYGRLHDGTGVPLDGAISILLARR